MPPRASFEPAAVRVGPAVDAGAVARRPRARAMQAGMGDSAQQPKQDTGAKHDGSGVFGNGHLRVPLATPGHRSGPQWSAVGKRAGRPTVP